MVDVMKLQRRTERYEFADGIRDFQYAVWVFLLGIYMWLVWDGTALWKPFIDSAREQGTLFVVLVSLAFFSIPLIIMQGSLMLMNKYVRRRWLWRNTGVITPESWIVPRTVLLTSFAIMFGFFVVGMFAAVQFNQGWLLIQSLFVGTGAGLAYMYLIIGRRLALPRYQWIAIGGMVGTVLIVLLPITGGLMGLLLGVFWAAMLVISGVYGVLQVAQQQSELDDAA